jgi:4-carboxymuconolactone decarboxylase
MMSETTETLNAIAFGEAPVLEALTQMSLNTLELSGLDERTYMMVRIAGLVAMDAPPVAYAINAEAAIDVMEMEDIQGILVTLAPVIGSARVAAAASNIIDVFFEEVAADLEEESDDDSDVLAVTQDENQAEEYLATEAQGEEFADEERSLEMV